MAVWQIACGDNGRDYSRLFLQHDLMFLGPGKYGRYEPERYRNVKMSGDYSGHKIGSVASFVTDPKPGDHVLLRKGHRVVALGVVPDQEGYDWDETFDDVYGWDLQHTRRVIWQSQLSGDVAGIQKGGDLFRSRKQIPTFTRVKHTAILDPVRSLLSRCTSRPLNPKPTEKPEAPMTLEEFGRALFSKGLANTATDQVLRAIERQRRLLAWYDEHGGKSGRPDEHEVVSHMVLPLLLALGWSEQLLAVEWKFAGRKRIDLAGFRGTPTTPENCILVCEAKGIGDGLLGAWDQAVGYVQGKNLTNCRMILLTQGTRFYVYRRANGQWPGDPSGYFNVEKMRKNHPLLANTNAVDTLMALTPAGVLT